MRVILSTGYCNQKRSESAVDLIEGFENQEEGLIGEENDLSISNEEKPETFILLNHLIAVSPTSSVPLPEQFEPPSTSTCTGSEFELELKLPAATSAEEASRKRRLPPTLESQQGVVRKKSPSEIHHSNCYDDSKKPAAKMTAGRYASEERDPPPYSEYDADDVEENTISMVCYDPVHMESPSPNAKAPTPPSFSQALKQCGFEIREQEGDGNCLFRAVSLQVYGDPNMHLEVRNQCLDHMAKDEEHFSQFVEDEDFGSYLKRKRMVGVHGNNPEIQAISELFNRPVEVFTPENGATPLNIFQSVYKTSDVPIRLSYQDNHYDAVVDPLLPTAGLGLGLPGLQPGLADKMQMEEAVRESDQMADQADLDRVLEESHNDDIQRAIKESDLSVDQMYSQKALAMSDLEATDFEMEQMALASSLEAYRQHESGRKQGASVRLERESVNSSSIHVARIPAATEAPVFAMAAATAPAAAASIPTEEASPFIFSTSADEYPSAVQELVMNGFELSKVIHAYELIGDSFDDLLSFLMNTSAS